MDNFTRLRQWHSNCVWILNDDNTQMIRMNFNDCWPEPNMITRWNGILRKELQAIVHNYISGIHDIVISIIVRLVMLMKSCCSHP